MVPASLFVWIPTCCQISCTQSQSKCQLSCREFVDFVVRLCHDDKDAVK